LTNPSSHEAGAEHPQVSELLTLDDQSRWPLYKKIAHRLKLYIIEKGLKPGDKLPTEQELTAFFGVSRSSVREALRFLQSLGIVQIRQRHGVILQEPSLSALMAQLAYGLRFLPEPQADLWEARLVLETGALPLIAARLTSDNLLELDRLLAEMEEAVFAAPLYAQLDMRFHRTLLCIAQNAIILELAGVIEGFFSHPRYQVQMTPASRRIFTQEHRELRNRLAMHDLPGAQQILWTHLWRYHSTWGRLPHVVVDMLPETE
jgi:GntR family transcriptional repressor for pyruvate dehydrogenase complex